ncbi:MAG: hypothetical protein ACRD4S_10740 [Candidatus Acidiferrales bacterium]
MRNRRFIQCLAISALVALAGCSKSSTPANSSNPAPDNNTAANAPAQNEPSNAPAAVPEAPRPRPVMIAAGTVLTVTIDQAVSSKTNNNGDQFQASLAEPVTVNGRTVIPAGARATGTVTDAKSAGRFKGGASLALTLDSIRVRGKTYQIESSSYEDAGNGRGKRTAIGAGGGAGLGAIVGAIAGGGKGAAIGALAGGGAGTAGAAFTGKRDIELPAETRLHFKLARSVSIYP